ncbi:hypothetical protein HYH03_003410 [Edaphochlamys debaryana]|uniref:Uncharacterized protein n=1 Tax=Edaphochlamys debaryana TaxID=47281 RepID=A0A835YJ83_9CHLO|nr:hypothetical protein HYH03_003410 [Edaphochlamys debaryana]|eukprot:KAG2498664.1 hypothetical protein HYH03_003410 [Edaphochlamys debaryana]
MIDGVEPHADDNDDASPFCACDHGASLGPDADRCRSDTRCTGTGACSGNSHANATRLQPLVRVTACIAMRASGVPCMSPVAGAGCGSVGCGSKTCPQTPAAWHPRKLHAWTSGTPTCAATGLTPAAVPLHMLYGCGRVVPQMMKASSSAADSAGGRPPAAHMPPPPPVLPPYVSQGRMLSMLGMVPLAAAAGQSTPAPPHGQPPADVFYSPRSSAQPSPMPPRPDQPFPSPVWEPEIGTGPLLGYGLPAVRTGRPMPPPPPPPPPALSPWAEDSWSWGPDDEGASDLTIITGSLDCEALLDALCCDAPRSRNNNSPNNNNNACSSGHKNNSNKINVKGFDDRLDPIAAALMGAEHRCAAEYQHVMGGR